MGYDTHLKYNAVSVDIFIFSGKQAGVGEKGRSINTSAQSKPTSFLHGIIIFSHKPCSASAVFALVSLKHSSTVHPL